MEPYSWTLKKKQKPFGLKNEILIDIKNEILFDHFTSISLQMMLAEYQRVKSKMPPIIEQLMVPHLSKVEEALQPGLAALTWASLNIDIYLKNAFAKISKSV